MNLPKAYESGLSIEKSRIIELLPTDIINIAHIVCGIVFVITKWSGSSQVAFRALSQAVSSSVYSNIPIYIADTDSEFTQRFLEGLGYVPVGAGETLWVRNGAVEFFLAGYKDDAIQKLREMTDTILSPITE